MPVWMMLWLGVQGGVFAVWAVLAFRALFALRAEALRLEAGPIGPVASLRAFRRFVTAGQWRVARRRLGLVTLVLLALTLGGVWLQR